MADFQSVLEDARRLSQEELLELIDELWLLVPPDADLPLHPDWEPELERRVAALDAGTVKTIPWTTVRDDSLERIRHGHAS